MTGARVEIDWTRCDGHGLCAELLPQRISRDEWGYPLIDQTPLPAGDPDARRAVALCPALALRLQGAPARTPTAGPTGSVSGT